MSLNWGRPLLYLWGTGHVLKLQEAANLPLGTSHVLKLQEAATLPLGDLPCP